MYVVNCRSHPYSINLPDDVGFCFENGNFLPRLHFVPTYEAFRVADLHSRRIRKVEYMMSVDYDLVDRFRPISNIRAMRLNT